MLVYIMDIFFEMNDNSCMFILLTVNVVHDQKYVLTHKITFPFMMVMKFALTL